MFHTRKPSQAGLHTVAVLIVVEINQFSLTAACTTTVLPKCRPLRTWHVDKNCHAALPISGLTYRSINPKNEIIHAGH